MPPKIASGLEYDKLEDVIEIVLDIGRIPEIRHSGGKIEKVGTELIIDDDIEIVRGKLLV